MTKEDDLRGREERPGFGLRHPALSSLLATRAPAFTHEVVWNDGAMPLRVDAYNAPAELPESIVSSVRCIVLVDGLVVLCDNSDGSHTWPGGRRREGESYIDTAAREVLEETGWLIDREGVRELGWLHLQHLGPRATSDDRAYPDFLQLVLCASASKRRVGRDDAWVDTEGYEIGSRLVTLQEALAAMAHEPASPFLQILANEALQ